MKKFKLDDIPKIESGFKIPDNYFENFSSNFIQYLPKKETIENPRVISIFRKKRTILIAVAAILILGLMIPLINTFETKKREVDLATLESYLIEESNIIPYDLIGETEPENSILNTYEFGDQMLEDILVSNSNIENLVIED